MATFGAIVALFGTLFGYPDARARFGVDDRGLGDLFALLHTGLLLATLSAGSIVDRYGFRSLFLPAALAASAGLSALALSQGYLAAAVSSFALGVACGGFTIGSNTLTSQVFAERRGQMLSFVSAFFGVGALVVPTLALLGGKAGPVLVPAVLVALTLLLTAAAGVVAFPQVAVAGHASGRTVFSAIRRPGVALFAALLFFHTGNEVAISGWASSYVVKAGWSSAWGTAVLVGYWLAAISGRFLCGHLHTRFRPATVLAWAAGGTVVGCLALTMSTSIAWLASATWFTSLAICMVSPSTIAAAGRRYHENTGSVFGALFSVGGLGAMSLPPVMGRLSEATSLRTALLVPVASACVVTALALLVRRRTRAD